MKEKLFTSIKSFKQKSVPFNDIIIVSIYLTFVSISLSMSNNRLYLEELILSGVIIGLSLLNSQNKNNNK